MKKIFTIWRFVIQVGFAKSLTWGNKMEKGEYPYYRTTLAGIMLLNQNGNKALELILGPFLLTIGWANKNQ